MEMTSRDRIRTFLGFGKVDRLPIVEWAPYWDKTIARWRNEGLPACCVSHEEIREYFGLDILLNLWVQTRTKACPEPERHGKPLIRNEKDYLEIKKYLYPNPAIDQLELERISNLQEKKGAALWIWFEGFFWNPRTLFGIEEHFYAFYDEPELMNTMNDDNLEYLNRVINQVCEVAEPQFLAIGEDMSYNLGPMISKDMFDEFLAPYYHEVVKLLKSKNIKVIIDSDGLVDEPVDWYMEAGCDGFLPLEKNAGVDILKYRNKHPNLLMMGGFDKLCMSRGENEMRKEFERILPVMKQGGYIPGVDHQTPPEVSMEDYKIYLKLLREYCIKAMK